MARVSLLNPYSLRNPQYEDRLTWAFLVTLKYDPFLQSFLRELVESKLPSKPQEHRNYWKAASVSTQEKGIDSSTNRLVSILLSDETIPDVEVKWSNRKATYDGVITYPDGLTLIIENKLSSGDVWPGQLSPSRSSFSGNFDDCDIHPSAICLEWSEVLEGVLKYADSEIVSFSNRQICLDLLSFVEEFHGGLTPYRTFRLCGDKPEALRRRTIRLLDSLASRVGLERRDDYLFRLGKIAERVVIKVDPEKRILIVALWPADTVRQARRFYENVDRTTFLDLNEWEVELNLHFSYMNTHLIHASTKCGTARYFDYFADGQFCGQMKPARLVPLAEQWEKAGLITGENRGEIEYQFNSTRREALNVIPGFSVSRVWDLSNVIDLEEQKKLEDNIIGALATPLKSWREKLYGTS